MAKCNQLTSLPFKGLTSLAGFWAHYNIVILTNLLVAEAVLCACAVARTSWRCWNAAVDVPHQTSDDSRQRGTPAPS